MSITSGQILFAERVLISNASPFRYLQQLVTAQGARNRELEQELEAYKRSESANGSVDSDSPKLSGYLGQQQQRQQQQPHRRSSVIGIGGTRTTPPSMSSSSDGGKDDGDDVLMLHDGAVIEFGSYGGGGGGGEGRGGLPSMPEGDDEDDHDEHHHHHHHHQRQEDMQVDNLGMAMNMNMGGMGGIHYSGMDNAAAAASESLRGRTRVVRRATGNGEKNGTGALKEEMGDDVDISGGGFGMGRM